MQQPLAANAEFPPELCTKPQALIGVSGLDTLNNAVHKSIWETFANNRRPERTPVLFKIIGNAHEFPVIKPKRNSYEWYIPKGILKRNWVNKHLFEIPSVMVIFYELDWNDPQWNEKMIECASRVQSMRAALEGRNSRLTVVLIQSTLPLPHGEDILASDRAITLCASCELNANSLFVLPHGDHLQGYAFRLETAFYEFSQNYYQTEIKNVRAHKEHLNKNAHQFLFVRHQFKMGILHELKQDIHTAHKHYTHAYNNLLEMRIVDTNALEIRTIAGFINYKLCRLMFSLNLPRDAISQFKAHIDRFRSRVGFQELTFEHYGWLSKQFSVFGDIFDEAVKQGLPAVQTQHPGIYYQQAAQYAILRKRSCEELCSHVLAYPYPDPLEGMQFLEFYGQRPWRPGKVSVDPPDPQLETAGIQALQFLEKQVSHSNLIVAMYGLAIAQYKIFRCPRTRRHLVLQMADEYYNSHDFGKALTLLTHMIQDFRAENWWSLVTDISEKALRCAYLTANVEDYVWLALDLLGSSSTLQIDEKRRIHDNLGRIFKRQIPFGDQKLTADILQNAVIQWQSRFKSELKTMDFYRDGVSCIAIKVRFTQEQYEVNQKVIVELFIKCTSPLPLKFTQLSINIKHQENIIPYVIDTSESLDFQMNEVKKFTVEFTANPSDVNKDYEVSNISLVLGDPQELSAEIKLGVENTSIGTSSELIHFKYCMEKVDFENIASLTQTLIVPRHSKLNMKIESAVPALLGEWFPIGININNAEGHSISNIKVEVNLAEEEAAHSTEFCSNLSGISETLPLFLNMSDSLQCNAESQCTFYLRANKIVENNVLINISYTLNDEEPVISIKSSSILVPVAKAFEINTRFVSSLMGELNKFYVGEELGVMPTVRCSSPWPIVIENTTMEFFAPFKSAENNIITRLGNMKLRNKEVGAELFLGVCDKGLESNATVGTYTVRWKRENGLSTITELNIVGHSVEWIPLQLKMNAPAHGFVRTPLLVTYHLYNRSHQLLHLDVSMESSEAFMYAGYKQFGVCVLPESTRTLQYNLYPLIAGNVALPQLTLSIPESGTEGPALRPDQLKLLAERSLPTHLYVMPQIKGAPKVAANINPRKTAIK